MAWGVLIVAIVVGLGVLACWLEKRAPGAGSTILPEAPEDPLRGHAWGCRCPGHR